MSDQSPAVLDGEEKKLPLPVAMTTRDSIKREMEHFSATGWAVEPLACSQ